VQCAPRHRLLLRIKRSLAWAIAFWLGSQFSALAQIPNINIGPDSGLASIDFAQIYLDGMNRRAREREQQKAQDRELIASGVVSALDLEAPNKAVTEYNLGASLMKQQNSKEAIKHLQRAIASYPKFVSAHIALGLSYVDQEEPVPAQKEFEAAATLDEKFPGSFLNLGLVALSRNEFATAQPELEKAASLSPNDARILSSLAYAQNGTHQYQHVLETARRVHSLDHKGLANVHYVAASAAMSLNDFDTVERELNLFLSEDSTNAFAPVARKNLAVLAHNKTVRAVTTTSSPQSATLVTSLQPQTFPNNERLKAQLTALGGESDASTCEDCSSLDDPNSGSVDNSHLASNVSRNLPLDAHAWTIRTSVDQVTMFFSVSSHGHMVNDLQAADIHVLDDNKPPERVEQFAPQSKLPLRLALLVDTSGSVRERFSFEKHAATKFLEKMLSGPSDLGFIAGFSHVTTVTQDFTLESADLGKGIDQLTNGGGTALFDGVTFACRKLAAYPDAERVARVLVILSDGEDNSSHSSLKQSIQIAERAGVTVYTVSTRDDQGDKTDADKILEVLAERSGGEAMFPGDIMTLGKSLDKLHDLIRSRYFIAYKPADFEPNGSYRSISVIAERDGKRLQVRARKGYHARMESGRN
jgi:Ca-activated chloride channel homolog